MPTRYLDDETPVVQFDPLLEVSPFELFRRLREGDAPLLVDLRSEPGAWGLAGAVADPGADWEPSDARDTILFDQEGEAAVARARQLQAAGYERVRALFGGLDLYAFSLDPEVVGDDTFLVRRGL